MTRVSVYDNVITPPIPVAGNVRSASTSDDDPASQLDMILTALYRDIGMLNTSLAVVLEEHTSTGTHEHLYTRFSCTGSQ